MANTFKLVTKANVTSAGYSQEDPTALAIALG